MYDKTIEASNKIISSEKLREIIDMEYQILNKYKAISAAEVKKNEVANYDEEFYTFKDGNSSMIFNINLYDDTQSRIDNYDEFIYVYDNRLKEIKSFSVTLYLDYRKTDSNHHSIFFNQSVRMSITEKDIDISTNLSSEDPILNDLYDKIRNIIIEAPDKYDKTIKNKFAITNIIALGSGLIFGIILGTLLLVNETIRELMIKTYIMYPLVCILVGFAIGVLVSQILVGQYYKKIEPSKVYKGFKNGKAVYVDDIENYKKKSEVLIGKNINNLNYRKKIMDTYSKLKKIIPIELLIIMIVTVIIMALGMKN